MQEALFLTGMVIKQSAVGEYDRRVVLLTKERGKVTAFARGARRMNNALGAATAPFCFGTFRLFEGKNAYTLAEANISNYFEGFRTDFEATCYGMYFLEIADYYTRENNDEGRMLKLLYQSLRALLHPVFEKQLIRSVYEIKTIVINGEFPGLPQEEISDACGNALLHIQNAPVEKLYTFRLSAKALEELAHYASSYRQACMHQHFKSLEILDTLSLNLES